MWEMIHWGTRRYVLPEWHSCDLSIHKIHLTRDSLVRDSLLNETFFQGLLLSCNQMSADYLFMQDKLYDVQYDTGDKVIQCGRHNDIFKLWLQWRAKVCSVD